MAYTDIKDVKMLHKLATAIRCFGRLDACCLALDLIEADPRIAADLQASTDRASSARRALDAAVEAAPRDPAWGDSGFGDHFRAVTPAVTAANEEWQSAWTERSKAEAAVSAIADEIVAYVDKIDPTYLARLQESHVIA